MTPLNASIAIGRQAMPAPRTTSRRRRAVPISPTTPGPAQIAKKPMIAAGVMPGPGSDSERALRRGQPERDRQRQAAGQPAEVERVHRRRGAIAHRATIPSMDDRVRSLVVGRDSYPRWPWPPRRSLDERPERRRSSQGVRDDPTRGLPCRSRVLHARLRAAHWRSWSARLALDPFAPSMCRRCSCSERTEDEGAGGLIQPARRGRSRGRGPPLACRRRCGHTDTAGESGPSAVTNGRDRPAVTIHPSVEHSAVRGRRRPHGRQSGPYSPPMSIWPTGASGGEC